MAKLWQPPTGRISAKVRSFSEVVKDLRFCVFSINRYRALGPPGPNQKFNIWALGSGFFVAPNVFLTCNHVMNNSKFPHQVGDQYQLVQNLGAGSVKLSPLLNFTIGNQLQLFPDKDAAIITVPGEPQPYASISYAEATEGSEIGVAGYPLSQILAGPNGEATFPGFIYRVAKGVVTSTIRQRLNPMPDPQTIELSTVEVNFMFVPGNSGGPIFDCETGRVLAFVHGFTDRQIVQRFVDTGQDKIAEGAPPKHVQALHAVYSLGIKLDNISAELGAAGVSL
jgi:Trypsin-like peptidase domain